MKKGTRNNVNLSYNGYFRRMAASKVISSGDVNTRNFSFFSLSNFILFLKLDFFLLTNMSLWYIS